MMTSGAICRGLMQLPGQRPELVVVEKLTSLLGSMYQRGAVEANLAENLHLPHRHHYLAVRRRWLCVANALFSSSSPARTFQITVVYRRRAGY